MNYSIYSDESYITAERYRSIAALSFPTKYFGEINFQLHAILKGSNVKEFKWEKLRNAKYRFCAAKYLDFIFKRLIEKEIRIDVIIWDTFDERHDIQGRDDIANFERMFFHLLKHVMVRREKKANWHVYPDEKHEIDWETVNDCLKHVGRWREYLDDSLFGNDISEQFFRINEFNQIVSSDEPCCQVADLFAGLAVFSKNSYSKYQTWCSKNSPQMCLFNASCNTSFSNKENERFHILKSFVCECKSKKLGVSITRKKCLHTFNPINPINYWHYVPQHPFDKAPTRLN